MNCETVFILNFGTINELLTYLLTDDIIAVGTSIPSYVCNKTIRIQTQVVIPESVKNKL